MQAPGKLEGNTVFTYLDAFCRPEHFGLYLPEYPNLDELKAHYQRGGLGDMKVKKFLNEMMQETLEQMCIRDRARNLFKRIGSFGSTNCSLYSICFFLLYLALGS